MKTTAEDRLKQRNQPRLTFWRALYESIAQTAVACVIILALVIYEFYRGNTISTCLLISALVILVVARFCIKLPNIYHHRLLRALDWHRWTEALDLVDSLRRINRFHFIKVPEIALKRYRAKALAGSGQLSQAVEEFAPCENQPGCPSWLYKPLLADIYDTAKQHEKALDLVKKALEEKQNPPLYIGLATRLLRCKKDTPEVKAALAEAEKGTLIDDIEKPIVLLCHGVVANLEKDYPAAKKHFQTSLEMLERTRHMPFREGHINKTKARLACVLARQGDLASAKRYFTEAREYLVETQESELLEECKKALGE